MKTLIVSLIVILAFSFVVAEEEAAPYKYIGADKCKMCHKSAKSGNQFGLWSEGPHAKAYATLATDEAKAIATEMGIEDPQKSDKCLSCHVTAYDAAAELKEATLTMEEGVSCEQCHGPGSEYKKMSTMKDREKAIAAGLIIPDEKTCLTCHNDKSPTYKEFKFEERLKAIAHPIPAAEEGNG